MDDESQTGMTKEQFFISALLILGPYDFSEPTRNANREQLRYMDRFYEIAEEAFGEDSELIKRSTRSPTLFNQYFKFWARKKKQMDKLTLTHV